MTGARPFAALDSVAVELRLSHAPWLVALVVVACSSSGGGGDAPPDGACAADIASRRFPGGGDGHADPYGARAAGQARAGRIKDAAQIVQPANGRNRVRVGDFVLANDRIALYVASEVRPDGYSPFGGKLLGIEPVGPDGRPRGRSVYGETFFLFSTQVVAPDSVTVLADGSDGKAAVVRASGLLRNLPFVDIFRPLSPDEYDFPAALDYVLEPGAERVAVRITLTNTRSEPVDFAGKKRLAFFHDYRADTFTEESGFAMSKGDLAFVANDGGEASFLFRVPGSPIRTGLGVSGFQLFDVNGEAIDACGTRTFDVVEIVAGGPGIDGVLEAKRRSLGEPPWREVRGEVREADGGPPVPGALVHVTSPDGRYLTRATAGADGGFVVHVPPGAASLTPTATGLVVPAATALGDGATRITLIVPRSGTIAVTAKDATTSEALPVRVQVVPQVSVAPAPEPWGVKDPVGGRLHQAFAMDGATSLSVPPGTHRVIVSRGYEYELLDATVTVTAGQTTTVDATLARSVDSAGVMCADFHVHAAFSVDAGDDVAEKVKSAIADGLEIPVSSEHEWVHDFQGTIVDLGLTKWAYSFPSEELTTFQYGHFGVIPMVVQPDRPNMGALDWPGKTPAQLFAEVAALPQRPVLIVNHPRGGISFEAYFERAGLDRATGAGTPDLWSEQFQAVEVFNSSGLDDNRDGSVADWFALLSAGKPRVATGASDSHRVRTKPVGYPRTCLTFGHDDPTRLSAEIVRDALASGAATVSGGLFMSVTGPGGVGPGGTAQAGSFEVEVRSPSWFEAATLEVIVDGVTTQTLPLTAAPSGVGPGKRATATVDVQAASSRPKHWVVFHARGADGKDLAPLHPGRKPFAVSNPIWF